MPAFDPIRPFAALGLKCQFFVRSSRSDDCKRPATMWKRKSLKRRKPSSVCANARPTLKLRPRPHPGGVKQTSTLPRSIEVYKQLDAVLLEINALWIDDLLNDADFH